MRLAAAGAAAALAILGACSNGDARPVHTKTPPPDPALVKRGMELGTSLGCGNCHSIDGTLKVGPTWKGLYGSRVTLDDGTVIVADDAYIAESIRDPDAKTVKGFPKGVMAAVIKPGSVSDDDIRALVAYIRTLS